MDVTKPTGPRAARWVPPPTVAVKFETLSELGKHPEKNCDFTKCYYCGEELFNNKVTPWLGTQTQICDFYCALCNKYTTMKQFCSIKIISDPETKSTSSVTVTMRYFTGYQHIKITEMRCTTPRCNKIHSFATIDQSEFINREQLECPLCKNNIIFIQQSQCLVRSDIRAQKQATTSRATPNNRALSNNNNGSRFTPLANLESPEQTENAPNETMQAAVVRTSKHREAKTRYRDESVSSRTSSASDRTLKRSHMDSPTTPPQNKRRADARSLVAHPVIPLPNETDSSAAGTAAKTCGERKTAYHSTDLMEEEQTRSGDDEHYTCNGTVDVSLDLSPAILRSQCISRGQHVTSVNNNSTKSSKMPRSRRFPPIVAHVPSMTRSDGVLRTITMLAAQHKCVLATDKRTAQVRIIPSSIEGRVAIIEALSSIEEAQYHTYGTPQERKPSKKVVAKGFMMGDFTENEIQENVRSVWGLQLERVVPLNNSVAVLIFSGDCDMRDIKAVTTIMYQRVKIDSYKVKQTAVTQCKRCLEFGHVKQHCGRTQRDPYYTDTDEDGNASTDPVATRHCTKCRVPGHTAVQARCPLFQEEIKKQRERRRKFQKQRESAAAAKTRPPPPAAAHPSTHRPVTQQVSYANAVQQKRQHALNYPPLPNDSPQAHDLVPVHHDDGYIGPRYTDVRQPLLNLMATMQAGLEALLGHPAFAPAQPMLPQVPTKPAAAAQPQTVPNIHRRRGNRNAKH